VNILAHRTQLSMARAWRRGDRGDKVMRPGAPAGTRGAREEQIMRIKWGPGRPNHVLQKGPEKWYMAMTQLYSSCSFG
jgi:hypothetical protein